MEKDIRIVYINPFTEKKEVVSLSGEIKNKFINAYNETKNTDPILIPVKGRFVSTKRGTTFYEEVLPEDKEKVFVPFTEQEKNMRTFFFDWNKSIDEPQHFGAEWECELVFDEKTAPKIEKRKLLRPAYTTQQKIDWYTRELQYQQYRATKTRLPDPRLREYPEKIEYYKKQLAIHN